LRPLRQVHGGLRVVQVVPLPLAESQPMAPPIQAAVDAASAAAALAAPGGQPPIRELRSMPFAAFFVELQAPGRPAGEALEAAAAALLARCAQHAGSGDVSYNVLLTSRFLMYVPRGREGLGPVDCNSMGFAGTMLLRSQEDLAFIKHSWDQRGTWRPWGCHGRRRWATRTRETGILDNECRIPADVHRLDPAPKAPPAAPDRPGASSRTNLKYCSTISQLHATTPTSDT
jgi:hypothetical protein